MSGSGPDSMTDTHTHTHAHLYTHTHTHTHTKTEPHHHKPCNPTALAARLLPANACTQSHTHTHTHTHTFMAEPVPINSSLFSFVSHPNQFQAGTVFKDCSPSGTKFRAVSLDTPARLNSFRVMDLSHAPAAPVQVRFPQYFPSTPIWSNTIYTH